MSAANAVMHDVSFSDATVSVTVATTASITTNALATMPGERPLDRIERQLKQLTEMHAGWDGYGTPAPGWHTATFALLVLKKVMRSQSPIPQVVPSSVGGIQLEWHEKDIDLELHISAPYQFEMWFHDHRQSATQPISVELSADFAPLKEPIRLLTVR